MIFRLDLGLIGLAIALYVSAPAVASDFRGPRDAAQDTGFETNESVAYRPTDSTRPSRLMIRKYQNFIGPTKGNRCPMSPSCSNYALQAYRGRSSLTAFFMTVDRLNRCGHDIGQYPVIVVANHVLRYDPVVRQQDSR